MFYPSTPFAVGHTPDGHRIYDAGTFEAQMVILLHELAHKTNPKGFTRDNRLDDPLDASEKNTNVLIDHCKNAINWLKSLFNKK
jgi:hypothetical protein